MPDAPLKLVTLVGSLRKGSFNAALARALPELAPDGVEISPLPSIGELPLYNQDAQEEQGFPARVDELAEAIRAADGLIIVTPEYNYSMPGVLKNAIDWLSRLDDQPFKGKPVAIQSASMSGMGGVRCQHHLRQSLVFVNAIAMAKPEVFVPTAQDKVENGKLTDEKTREHAAKQLAEFAGFVRRLRD